ncbi:MAG: GTP 3',8-cyclase MoaA [Pyrinomonadaceae bacterium]
MENRSEKLFDAHGRQIRDLRISLTDRCNFRCFYCLPNGEPPLARKDTILTFEEIVEISEIFVSLGIEKIRLTGGEPLIRKDVEKLVSKISALKPKLKDLALTTNGHTLKDRASDLVKSGLDRITISLDSLKQEKFKQITGVDKLDMVLDAIRSAKKSGLDPVKINAVIVRDHNDDEIVEFARFARRHELSMRFIEFMPLDSGHEWKRGMVVSGDEIRKKIESVFPLKIKSKSRGTETAWNYGFEDGAGGEIGIIAPVTQMFCGACSRIRLTADGQIRTCLFSNKEHNLRDVLRNASGRPEIIDFIRDITLTKEAGHQINDKKFVQPSRTMSFIGG